MFSQKTLTTILIITILALSYQTYSLVVLGKKLEAAQIGFGGSSVSFAEAGGAPDMVGGC